MDKLKEYRNEIDLIDEKIIKFFKERMFLVKKVIEYKLENNLPILQTGREEEMIKNNLIKLDNKELEKYYLELLNSYLKISKDYQKEILKNK